jgi:hypothetical protein
MSNLRLPANSQSQSFQDAFVLNLHGFKKNGFFVEIGSNHPVIYSNTFLLEYKYGWSGVAFEISKSLVKRYRAERNAVVYCCDATDFDYDRAFSKVQAPLRIDYLQVDIEPSAQSLKALKLLPHQKYRFSVITFEHDSYANADGKVVKQQAYDFLTQLGYSRVVDNVMSKGCAYEDWYCDTQIFESKFLEKFKGKDVEDLEYFSDSELIH